MWLDWLVFCDYGLCVCPLMPLVTPTVLLGFLLPWAWGISSQLLQQSAASAPYLGRGVSPHSRPSWTWTWSSSSRPSCTHTATASGRGVAPLGCRPWPRAAAMPDLGHGVAPQKNIQNKSKHKNNKYFSWINAVRFLSLTGSHSWPHLPRMPSNTVLASGLLCGQLRF